MCKGVGYSQYSYMLRSNKRRSNHKCTKEITILQAQQGQNHRTKTKYLKVIEITVHKEQVNNKKKQNDRATKFLKCLFRILCGIA